jgi:hypothetical protein
MAAAVEIQALDAHLRELERVAAERFPLDDDGARDLLAALSARLQRIVDAEQAAAERLAALST